MNCLFKKKRIRVPQKIKLCCDGISNVKFKLALYYKEDKVPFLLPCSSNRGDLQ